MSKPLIQIHNITSSEIIEREMTESEFAQYKIDQTRTMAKYQAEEEAVTAKAALLERLGITADEAALLLG